MNLVYISKDAVIKVLSIFRPSPSFSAISPSSPSLPLSMLPIPKSLLFVLLAFFVFQSAPPLMPYPLLSYVRASVVIFLLACVRAYVYTVGSYNCREWAFISY